MKTKILSLTVLLLAVTSVSHAASGFYCSSRTQITDFNSQITLIEVTKTKNAVYNYKHTLWPNGPADGIPSEDSGFEKTVFFDGLVDLKKQSNKISVQDKLGNKLLVVKKGIDPDDKDFLGNGEIFFDGQVFNIKCYKK